MYYIIINHTNQIIAADNSFLQAIHADTLENFNRQLILETISLDTKEENEVLVKTDADILHFKSVSTTLSSILGDLTLVNVSHTEHKNIDVPPAIPEVELELFDLTIPKTPKRTIESIEAPEDVEISFDEISIPQINLHEKTSIETEVDSPSPIYIDIAKVSEEIGISQSDYNHFLSEYIDTAISLEPDLRASNQSKKSSASHTLMQLADVLQLPVLNSIIEKLDTSDTETSTSIVEKFYDTLSKLTTKEGLSKEVLQKETVSKTTQASNTEHEASLLMDDLLFFDDLESQDTVQASITEKKIGTAQKDDISP
ncbi:MAG: hypothetical protein U9N11_06900, partial [Campylobacterota bacterium]|nr:hypothetical protein [Campylobacterota bacterium]